MPESERTILSLNKIARNLPKEKRVLFERIYEVEVSKSKTLVPKEMKAWVKSRFGSVKNAETQTIVHLRNRLTGEGCLFNSLRASRPFDTTCKTLPDIGGKENCLFCEPEKNTPSDPFGRIKGKFCLTAGNIAKYDYFHSVLIFQEHNPLRLKKDWLEDYLKTAERWFGNAEKKDPNAKNRLLMWNCLWRSGASILHGHMQLTASKTEYGRLRHLREISQSYSEIFGSDYFSDILSIHKSLGLAKNSGNIWIIAYLTPVKDSEIWIMSRRKNFSEMSPAIFRVLQKYKKIGVQTYNLVIFQINGWWICRLLDRGDLKNKSSDIGSMELFADSVIASDPFRVIEEI
jgi:galactose-1-phosphate uridylyltransferase